LRVGDTIVKAFRTAAGNQELILNVFQEEGWPYCIDDPLSPSGKIQPKQRLLTTIKSLNRNQSPHLILFHGDGSGLHVCWKWREAVAGGGL
jgi:hypothetical protein